MSPAERQRIKDQLKELGKQAKDLRKVADDATKARSEDLAKLAAVESMVRVLTEKLDERTKKAAAQAEEINALGALVERSRQNADAVRSEMEAVLLEHGLALHAEFSKEKQAILDKFSLATGQMAAEKDSVEAILQAEVAKLKEQELEARPLRERLRKRGVELDEAHALIAQLKAHVKAQEATVEQAVNDLLHERRRNAGATAEKPSALLGLP